MKVYLTSGTMDFMELLQKRYENETMVAMHGVGNSMLLHETEGKSLFQTPRRYEVIGSFGDILDKGFFAFNNITVSDEGRPIFEHQFANQADTIKEEPGFIAFRLLRPLDSDTYIIMTEWSQAQFFNTWKNSSSYQAAHKEPTSLVGTDKTSHIFASAPYITTFTSIKEDE